MVLPLVTETLSAMTDERTGYKLDSFPDIQRARSQVPKRASRIRQILNDHFIRYLDLALVGNGGHNEELAELI